MYGARQAAKKAERPGGTNGDCAIRESRVLRRGGVVLRSHAGAIGHPVLHVGLYHRHQQHLAAASAQRFPVKLHSDNSDRIRLVHRLLYRLHTSGKAHRTDRLQAFVGGRAFGDGRGRLVDDPGRAHSLLLGCPDGVVHHRLGHHPASGRRQPLCGPDRPPGFLPRRGSTSCRRSTPWGRPWRPCSAAG